MEKQKRRALNPIKTLRKLLGDVTQAELAKLTDTPVDTIRNIENARRSLSSFQLERIKVLLGAQWDGIRWHLIDRPEVPYTVEIYRRFRIGPRDQFYQRTIDTHILMRRLVELFNEVEPQDYNRLFHSIFDHQDKLRTELHITGARRLFEKTQFKIELEREEANTPLTSIVRTYQLDKDIIAQAGEDGKATLGNLRAFTFAKEPASSALPPADVEASPASSSAKSEKAKSHA